MDLIHWEKTWHVVTPDDRSGPPETPFCARSGYLVRGGLCVGPVKVLHDNLRAEVAHEGSFGVGHAQLPWRSDGKTQR